MKKKLTTKIKKSLCLKRVQYYIMENLIKRNLKRFILHAKRGKKRISRNGSVGMRRESKKMAVWKMSGKFK